MHGSFFLFSSTLSCWIHLLALSGIPGAQTTQEISVEILQTCVFVEGKLQIYEKLNSLAILGQNECNLDNRQKSVIFC